MKKLALTVIVMVVMVTSLFMYLSSAQGGTIVDGISFTEATTNADKTPLEDLCCSFFYYSISGGPYVSVIPEGYTASGIPATSLNGGGDISGIDIAIPVPEGQTVSVSFVVTHKDTLGNEGNYSDPLIEQVTGINIAPSKPLSLLRKIVTQ